ncbi:polysaccharide deacetylase family protein [Xanthobacter autotrophicus]|uniref:polysaccharide deacetylase family protein n=1 Tax=Xanthobacter TaxID=279 RepID=UPI001E41EC5D|nr:polysaccharide deacetylase family protein [Xanthobacter autotrophicus]UDQ87924.1 polysaccharide deacetylase family protein [Xanthobacter autotrophicus]
MTAATSTPVAWPLDRPLALSVSVMLEAWSDDSAPGIGPMGNPLKAGVLDLQGRSWADYGPKVGTWRILDALAAADVKAVFYVSGILAERYPDLMKAIVAAGHDIAAHAWAQNIVPAYQTEAEERADLLRCISTIEATSGRRPAGWISPRCTPSAVTSALLAEQGFAWHSDIFDTDVPYKLETPRGSVVGVPFTMEVNDMPLYIRYGNEPRAFTQILERLLSQWPDAPKRPCCLDITVHAHVFGRPYGIIELIESLRLARRYEALARLTTHAELAALCA